MIHDFKRNKDLGNGIVEFGIKKKGNRFDRKRGKDFLSLCYYFIPL